MTGTAKTEAEEFHKIYGLEVVPIPTHRPMVRRDKPDLIYKTEKAKFERSSTRSPSGTRRAARAGRHASSRRPSGWPRCSTARASSTTCSTPSTTRQEAQIIADAGQRGAVTIATNMAGRGTDIMLGEGVAEVGGLHIIGTERHESRRIDNQLRGRAGRQGDPGESRFFCRFEDDLMRLFGGERMQGIMDRLGVDDDTPIEAKMVSQSIENAQKKVEGHNYDIRKHVLEYDDVMNKQREIIYGERRKVLEGTDTRSNFVSMVEHVVAAEVPTFCEGRHRETWDFEGLWERMHQFAPALPPLSEVDMDSLGNTVEDVCETLSGELIGLYEEKEQEYGPDLLREVEQSVMLQVIDTRWLAYLTQMDHLREGMGFQAYGQMDPLVEYKAAAFTAFQDLTEDIQREIVRALLNVQIRRVDPAAAAPAEEGSPEAVAPAPTAGAANATAPQSPRADRPGGATDGTQVPRLGRLRPSPAAPLHERPARGSPRRSPPSPRCATSWSHPRLGRDVSTVRTAVPLGTARAVSRARSAATRHARAAQGRSTSSVTGAELSGVPALLNCSPQAWPGVNAGRRRPTW